MPLFIKTASPDRSIITISLLFSVLLEARIMFRTLGSHAEVREKDVFDRLSSLPYYVLVFSGTIVGFIF